MIRVKMPYEATPSHIIPLPDGTWALEIFVGPYIDKNEDFWERNQRKDIYHLEKDKIRLALPRYVTHSVLPAVFISAPWAIGVARQTCKDIYGKRAKKIDNSFITRTPNVDNSGRFLVISNNTAASIEDNAKPRNNYVNNEIGCIPKFIADQLPNKKTCGVTVIDRFLGNAKTFTVSDDGDSVRAASISLNGETILCCSGDGIATILDNPFL